MAIPTPDGGSGTGKYVQLKCRVFKTKGATLSANYEGHNGVDVTAEGTSDYVVAHSAGTVIWVQKGYGNLKGSSGNASYGNVVKMQHSNGYYTLYAHLRSVLVSEGQTLPRGTVLGYMGESGNAYGAHLHFEVFDKTGNRLGYASRNYLNTDLPGLTDGGWLANGGNTGSGNSGSSVSGAVPGKPANNTGNAAATLAGTSAAPPNVEITKVIVKTTVGSAGARPGSLFEKVEETAAQYEVLVQNGGKVTAPVLVDAVTLEWQRKGTPGALNFSCAVTEGLGLEEGDPVSFRADGKTVFFGYIFERSRSDTHTVSVKAYDQLRYLKNKGTLAYANKTYTEVLRMLAKDYGLTCGTLEDTGYKIPQRIEDGTLFDILGNASDTTVMENGKLFVLYDDCGKLCLRHIESMMLPLLIDADTTTSFKYSTTIDRDVYTRITLASDNSQTGERELYVQNNTDLQSELGVLQYYESVNGASAAKLRETAKLLSSYYGKPRRSLSLTGCIGDIRVRAGVSLVVKFDLDDIKVQNYMIVEKVKHKFENGLHAMDLDVSGIKGQFVV